MIALQVKAVNQGQQNVPENNQLRWSEKLLILTVMLLDN